MGSLLSGVDSYKRDVHALLLKEAEQRLPVLIEQKLRGVLG